MVEDVVMVLFGVIIGICAKIVYEYYEDDASEGEGYDMAKQPTRVSEREERETARYMRKIDGYMQTIIMQNWRERQDLRVLDAKLMHLIDHAHHIEDLIVAGNTSGDQAKMQEILDKIKAGKDKVTAALKAITPSEGDTPQP